MRNKYILIGIVVGVLLSSVAVVVAGNIDSPAGPTESAAQMYTVEQIYDRLNDGTVATKQTTFQEPASAPGSTMHTLDEIMAKAPSVDDTKGATAADVASGKTFWGLTTSGWGLKTGTAVANADPPCFDNANRYVDCGNGTVNDTVTGLIWLKDPGCFGQLDYAAANNAAAGLEDGECGLTDGSSPGDWRLPTEEEWEATVERAVALGCRNGNGPSLTNTPGTGCYKVGPQPFTGVQSYYYWSSTINASDTDQAWYAHLNYGLVYLNVKRTATFFVYVWPVRGGQ